MIVVKIQTFIHIACGHCVVLHTVVHLENVMKHKLLDKDVGGLQCVHINTVPYRTI